MNLTHLLERYHPINRAATSIARSVSIIYIKIKNNLNSENNYKKITGPITINAEFKVLSRK